MFVLQRRREECERKARRGEMDPRLEYTFQLLIDATGLPRGELMDYIFDGNMVCLPLYSHPCMKAGLRNQIFIAYFVVTKRSFLKRRFDTALLVTTGDCRLG